MSIPRGFIIWCGPDDADGFEDAKAFLKREGYGKSDVRMWREGGFILVETLREVR